VSTQVRERVPRSEVRQVGVAKLPFGLNLGEAIAVVLAAAVLVWAVAQYFSSLKPEQDRLRAIQAELDAQQRSIIANAPGGAAPLVTEDQAAKALESLETFKGRHLKPFSSGRIDLIKEINALAKKNSVTLTSGIDMGATGGEADAEGNQTSENKSASKHKKADELLNVFPSVSFRFTVFGQYSNVKTFINEVEREKQFVVINSVNFTNQEAKTAGRRSRGGEGGATGIMLTIEMSAYFQPIE
jgi:hypothetical protein